MLKSADVLLASREVDRLNRQVKAEWERLGVAHTAHELRHTMADRLREVQCPEDIRKSIGGCASADVASRYGKGYSLQVMREWLLKNALVGA